MSQALAQYRIVGLAANIAFLKRLVEGEAFATADLDTGLIERNHDALFPAAQPAAEGALALAAVALIEAEKEASAAQSGANAADPWGQALGWRMNTAYTRSLSFTDDYAAALPSKAYNVQITYRDADWVFNLPSCPDAQPERLSLMSQQGTDFSICLLYTSPSPRD